MSLQFLKRNLFFPATWFWRNSWLVCDSCCWWDSPVPKHEQSGPGLHMSPRYMDRMDVYSVTSILIWSIGTLIILFFLDPESTSTSSEGERNHPDPLGCNQPPNIDWTHPWRSVAHLVWQTFGCGGQGDLCHEGRVWASIFCSTNVNAGRKNRSNLTLPQRYGTSESLWDFNK